MNIGVPILFPTYVFITVVIILTTRKSIPYEFNSKYLMAAVCIFLIALCFQILDRARIFCDPQSLFQGHALWHILAGVSTYISYLFFASERVPEQERLR